jgi:hypothetical protein
MPILTAEASRQLTVKTPGMWWRPLRPRCYICGRFIGPGGYYDVMYDDYNGGWEEGYSTCAEHTKSEPTDDSA